MIDLDLWSRVLPNLKGLTDSWSFKLQAMKVWRRIWLKRQSTWSLCRNLVSQMDPNFWFFWVHVHLQSHISSLLQISFFPWTCPSKTSCQWKKVRWVTHSFYFLSQTWKFIGSKGSTYKGSCPCPNSASFNTTDFLSFIWICEKNNLGQNLTWKMIILIS